MPAKLTAHSYGKSAIRLTKVTRRPDRHDLIELEVAIELTGDFADTYLTGDNSKVIATDTMKNTVYALAAANDVDPIDRFAQTLARHFVDRNPHVASAAVDLARSPWDRVVVEGVAHPHAFVGGGNHRRTARVVATRDGTAYGAGLDGMLLLKTGGSAFAGFIRDEFTTLPDTDDRIVATRLTARWDYAEPPADFDRAFGTTIERVIDVFARHESRSVQQTLYAMGEAALGACPEIRRIESEMPNQHRVPFDLGPLGLPNRNEVFVATSEPYGLIRATMERA